MLWSRLDRYLMKGRGQILNWLGIQYMPGLPSSFLRSRRTVKLVRTVEPTWKVLALASVNLEICLICLVFGMLLGDTIILDNLDCANSYRQEVWEFFLCVLRVLRRAVLCCAVLCCAAHMLCWLVKNEQLHESSFVLRLIRWSSTRTVQLSWQELVIVLGAMVNLFSMSLKSEVGTRNRRVRNDQKRHSGEPLI